MRVGVPHARGGTLLDGLVGGARGRAVGRWAQERSVVEHPDQNGLRRGHRYGAFWAARGSAAGGAGRDVQAALPPTVRARAGTGPVAAAPPPYSRASEGAVP